jgi:hypothetical protein
VGEGAMAVLLRHQYLAAGRALADRALSVEVQSVE